MTWWKCALIFLFDTVEHSEFFQGVWFEENSPFYFSPLNTIFAVYEEHFFYSWNIIDLKIISKVNIFEAPATKIGNKNV